MSVRSKRFRRIAEEKLREVVLALVHEAAERAGASERQLASNVTEVVKLLTAFSVHFAKTAGLSKQQMVNVVSEIWDEDRRLPEHAGAGEERSDG